MTRLTKAIKYLTGKMTDALCPVCGRWMKKDSYVPIGGKAVDIWYCTNSQHEGTKKEV